jgi:hypothetical protein
MKRKIYKLFSLALLLSVFTNVSNAQNVYFREGFQDDEPWPSILAESTTAYYYSNQFGSWFLKTAYRSAGPTGSCTAVTGGPNHLRFGNNGGLDSGFIVTPVANFGINTLTFYMGRISRRVTVYKRSDTVASPDFSTWTLVRHFPTTGFVACDQFTVSVNDATARRLMIVGRAGTDSDIDSLVMTSTSAIVPVKFGDINLSQANGLVKLNWNVLLEVNTEKYYVERSVNGVEFASIGSLSATNAKSYAYVDAAPLNVATGFYRLKAVDKDGKITYSNVLRLNSKRSEASVVVTPNPIINGTVNLQLNNFTKSDYSVSLFDASGKIAFTKKMNIESGSSAQILQLPNTVSKGIYQLQITNGSIKMNKTVVVQ